MNIHTTLKNIRIEKEMTQELVADKIGLTRQAISAYESGKRQPGLDILMSLSELYEVDIENILYGTKKTNHNKLIRNTAIIVTAVFLILRIASRMLSALAYINYPLEEGIVLQSEYYILEMHNEFIRATSLTDYFSRLTLIAGTTTLFAMTFCLSTSYKSKHKLLYMLILFSVTFLNDVFWSVIHPVYPLNSFIWESIFNLLIPVCIILFNIAISEIMQYTKKRKR